MSNDSSKIKDVADSIKGIVEAVPIYQDLVQPTAIEIGKGLQTVAKTLHIALAPVSALVWGYEKINEYLTPALEQKFKDKAHKIITPDPSIAGPVVEALRFAGHNETLRDLFTNLLATSMTVDIKNNAHPSFVEIIKQMTSDEAKILSFIENTNQSYPVITLRARDEKGFANIVKNFNTLGYQSKCTNPQYSKSYVENLNRLSIVEISYTTYVIHEGVYDKLENHPEIISLKNRLVELNKIPQITRGSIELTELGKQFCKACIN